MSWVPGKLAVAGLLILLSGCASVQRWYHNGKKVGPEYCRPVVPVAADWIDEDSQYLREEPDRHHEWWTAFEDTTMDQLVAAAYQQNLTLRSASLRVLEARTQRNIAAANLLPQSQSHFGSYSRNQNSTEAAMFIPLLPRNFSQWQTGFDLSWELDVWGRIRRSIEAAEASWDAEVENYDDILVTLIGDVVATYVELRAFDERIGLAEENARIQQGSLDIAAARFREGLVSELDVQQARSNLADTRALVPSLQLARRQTLNRLAILLGMLPNELEPILAHSGRIPEPPPHLVVGIPANLLRRRPDIRAAERQIAAQSAQIGIAEAELYPQFAINGEISLSSRDVSNLFTSSGSAGLIAPGFRWKILHYGRLVNNIRVQELRFQNAIVQYENVVLAAHREVEDAIVEFLRSKERELELKKSADAAARSVELVRFQYREGGVDFGRVFLLESVLVERQDQLVATRAQVAVAIAKVYKALGGGWQIRQQLPYSGQADFEMPVPQANDAASNPPRPPGEFE